MLNLDNHLSFDRKSAAKTVKEANLCSRFTERDLATIGGAVYEGYKRDLGTRFAWLRRNEAGMDLALQMQKPKSFPWPGCSNVAFPLVTIGSMQFHARAYPAIISGTDVAKCRVIGPDPSGEESLRADRISTHMSWQCLEEDQSWEEQHDTGMLNYSIVGTNFMKSYFDAKEGYNVSDLVLAKDLVVDYYAKSIESAPRKTQCIPLPRNAIYEKVKRGVYRDVLKESWFSAPPANNTQQTHTDEDKRAGRIPPQADETTPYSGLEQHVQMDLDGDGYAEPYIITIEETTQTVLRIVTGFDREEDIERAEDGEIISIRALQYYTKYTFIPSPDGGIYGIGFGVLLGPLNESTNSLINQLIDAGTMSTTAGGFLGRGAKIRGGTWTFAPLEWKRVDSAGEDLQKSIFPLPVREPSPVLFQLLGLLIDYTNRISGANDMMVGENPGQNTPAETSRAMIEQGSKIYTAIFKRYWRALKEELKKRYILNALYLPDKVRFGAEGQEALREDYLGNPNAIAPAADPNITSEGQRLMQAQAVKASAATTPGYDTDEAERFYLRAIKVPPESIAKIFVGKANTPPGEDPKVTIQKMKDALDHERLQFEQQKFINEMQEEIRLNDASILKIQGELAIAAESAEGDKMDRQINAMNTMLGMAKQRNEQLQARVDHMVKVAQLAAEDVHREADREVEREKIAKQAAAKKAA